MTYTLGGIQFSQPQSFTLLFCERGLYVTPATFLSLQVKLLSTSESVAEAVAADPSLYATLASDPSFTSALLRSPELAETTVHNAELAYGLSRSPALRTAIASVPSLAGVIAKVKIHSPVYRPETHHHKPDLASTLCRPHKLISICTLTLIP
jgi:hypothetical protein